MLQRTGTTYLVHLRSVLLVSSVVLLWVSICCLRGFVCLIHSSLSCGHCWVSSGWGSWFGRLSFLGWVALFYFLWAWRCDHMKIIWIRWQWHFYSLTTDWLYSIGRNHELRLARYKLRRTHRVPFSMGCAGVGKHVSHFRKRRRFQYEGKKWKFWAKTEQASFCATVIHGKDEKCWV